jgi:transketolase
MTTAVPASNISSADLPRSGAVAHRDLANAIRALAMDAVQQANSGHPGMPMGMADVATVLAQRFLKFDASDPTWPDRDRLVLSAGHGSMLLYALLYLTGYAEMPIEALRDFRQLGSRTAGHPEVEPGAGIETTTGPLGQGLATAVGMALAERMLAARFGDGLVDHHTYVIASDGDLMEGVSHEAISLAGHLGLDRLIVLYDDNEISIDGPTTLTLSDDQQVRFRAAGWHVQAIDGHDPEAIAGAIDAALAAPQPSMIACRTVIGFGAPKKQGTAAAHGAPLGPEEIAAARERLAWPHPPFEVPAPILQAWREAGRRCNDAKAAWLARLASDPEMTAFQRALSGELPGDVDLALSEFKRALLADAPRLATRQHSKKTLDVLVKHVPALIGGSADLTGSNGTLADGMQPVTRDAYDGRYIFYGVREHGMAALMNGLALHGGFVPYGGTFLTFSDYCRPAIRLAALMRQRVVFVMTHDSIGLGEDGPTHQPVEHLASLRAIPNLQVFRPADGVETLECWQLALAAEATPSVLALTRQGVPALRTDAREPSENRCARGGYVLQEAADGGLSRQVTLIATGSEVAIAVEARAALEAEGIGTAVVSLPCWSLFDAQPETYRKGVLGETAVRVAVEAAIDQGWDRYVGTEGSFVGMHGFGASAPAGALYRHFGITPEAVVAAAKAGLAAG